MRCVHTSTETQNKNFRFTSKIRTLLRFPLGDIVITIRKRVCRRRRQVKQPSKNEQKSHYRYTKQKEKNSHLWKNDNRINKYKKKTRHTQKTEKQIG